MHRPPVASHAGGLFRSPYWLAMANLLPIAHVGHWLWALYLPPILIVLGSIARTTLSERRKKRDSSAGGTGEGGARMGESANPSLPRDRTRG
jgi:hypothetical protein